MTDILLRLRGDIPHRLIEDHWTVDFEDLDAEREEAANEIERLLKANENLRMEIIALLHIADRDEAEIERLRKENGRLDSNNKELLYDNKQKFAELQRLQGLEGK